jgi:hypothetical protein
LFTVAELPRGDYRPDIYIANAERNANIDPVVTAIRR